MEYNKPSLLIIYDHFYPAYKAGGPIQSLNNLVITLGNAYSISVITSAYDLNSNTPLADIRPGEWNTILLPSCRFPISIWYAKKQSPGIKKLKQLIAQIKPAFIYLNGIFSYRFFILPLIAIKRLDRRQRVIICPRGMLQPEALLGKLFKKKIYLNLLSISGLLQGIRWQATGMKEKEDILKTFGHRQQVKMAGNIPKKPASIIKFPAKKNNQLHLVYLSLIAEKKNLLLVLKVLEKCSGIGLDIYGPVKDVAYWRICKKKIDQMPEKVRYKGEVIPERVQEIFEQYDASILLTKGENFGHALYESLSVGRPVITSHFTPWTNLRQQKAGWNIDITSPDEGILLMKNLCNMESHVFNDYCIGSHKMANNYYSQLNSVDEYKKLFSFDEA